jgi:hypothetical protein
MERLFCEIHNADIIIYNKEDEIFFKDDNRQEVAIFYDENNKKYLKRFIMNQCDFNCETIKQILEE